jgi:hypothetical protein
MAMPFRYNGVVSFERVSSELVSSELWAVNSSTRKNLKIAKLNAIWNKDAT